MGKTVGDMCETVDEMGKIVNEMVETAGEVGATVDEMDESRQDWRGRWRLGAVCEMGKTVGGICETA